MPLLTPSLNEIYAPIQAGLKEFSKILQSQLDSEDELIRAINQHLLKMSGKFLRPALTLFSFYMDGREQENARAIKLAAAIELIHTATLVHDDIIDNSLLRRNQPSVYSKWGREISIISGDYIYAKAFLLLASIKDAWVNEAFAACAQVICEGEMKQVEMRKNFLMSENEYIRIIHQKTAALFQAACMGGAHLAGNGKEKIEALGTFGFNLGLAFQIVDDCLDLTGDPDHLGKTTGLDIYKNDVTLPLLYLHQNGNGLKNKDPEEIRELCIKTGAVDKAMDKARKYGDQAINQLEAFPPSPYKEGLTQLAQHCLDRVR